MLNVKLASLAIKEKELDEELKPIETELHDLKGDTQMSAYENKSTEELREMIKKFEDQLARVQEVLESRITG